jgi:hypothetical protein
MRAPHFVTLAKMDEQHFITACRHGVVHLTWARATMRFATEEFRRLTRLLAQATDRAAPVSVRDGKLRITFRPDEDCELQIGELILLVPAERLCEFARAAREALQHLDELVSSGVWATEEAEEEAPSFVEQLQRMPFSEN